MAAVRRVIPRKAVMSVTESAAKRIQELMSTRSEPTKGIRIGVKKRGCTGLSYTMNYVSDPNKLDDCVSQYGVSVWVDPKAVMHIVGTTMDYKEDELGSEFVFKNPNESAKCGCGESFMTNPNSGAAATTGSAPPVGSTVSAATTIKPAATTTTSAAAAAASAPSGITTSNTAAPLQTQPHFKFHTAARSIHTRIAASKQSNVADRITTTATDTAFTLRSTLTSDLQSSGVRRLRSASILRPVFWAAPLPFC